MSDQILRLPTDTPNTGKLLDASELTVGVNVVERERVNIADPTDASGIAKVLAAPPVGTEYGQVVRPIMGQLVAVPYDEIDLGYTGANLTTVTYKRSGSTVATLTLTYSGTVLQGVVRS